MPLALAALSGSIFHASATTQSPRALPLTRAPHSSRKARWGVMTTMASYWHQSAVPAAAAGHRLASAAPGGGAQCGS